jgi:ParB family chromosome partitioning protein
LELEVKTVKESVVWISVTMIAIGENIRKHVEREALGDLIISIKQHGLLNPPRVYELEAGKRYELESGQRRFLAACQAGLTEVPCLIVPRPTDSVETGLKQHAENSCRQPETLIERGFFYQACMAAKGWTAKQLAWAIGEGESDISRAVNTVKLLPLPLHEHVKSGALAGRTAYDIARARLADEAKVEIGQRAIHDKLKGLEVKALIDAATGKKAKPKKTTIRAKGFKVTVENAVNKQDIIDALSDAVAQVKRQ